MKPRLPRVYGDKKWRPIQFCLVVDDFGVEYVGKKHADHLATIQKNITTSLNIGRAKICW